ncbi:peptide ABC transporter substrate-binding protein [Pediococcus siamensis]|uniref:peptide ABC transporter substrate-binding protein n=1 Tax=Pediococcus siamensis TaxID=381829 RepID=UPI0039A033CA
MSIFTNKKSLLIAGIILIGGVSFGVRAHSNQTNQAPAQKINLYETTNLTSLDASKITDGVSSAQLSQVDEGLYRLNKNSQPVNALASKTTVSNHGKTYVIDLRHTGRWSNGDPVTAANFVYSWKRTLDPKTKSEFTYLFANFKNANAIMVGKKSSQTLGVQALNRYQLKVTLSKPIPYFKKLLAGTTFYPINQKIVQKFGSKYGTAANKTVYNGPFVLKGRNGTNDTWSLVKKTTYRAKKTVKLQRINHQVIKTTATAYNLYQANKLAMVTLAGEQNVQNKNNPELKTLSSGRVGFIQYNEKNKVAANKALRTAVSLTINRQQLVTKILENGSTAAKTFGVRNMLKNPQTGTDFVDDAYTKNTVDTNIPQAQKLYQQAQKQLGQKQITLTITCANDDTSQHAADYIQGQLTNHLKNIKVNVRSMPFPSMLTKVSQGDFQLNLTSWGMDFADPSQVLTILTSSSNSNMGHYQSKAYDTAMNAAAGADATNSSVRYQDLMQAAQTALKDQAVTPLYESRSRLLVKSNLHGVIYNKFSGALDFRQAFVK